MPVPQILRILDANLNRAREALRVMEDAARFLLDDAELAAPLKELRHALRDAAAMLPSPELCRDVASDVGTSMTTADERRRDDVVDVALAAGKRLGEALRSLEEFGKLIDESFAARIKALRYRGYELEGTLVARLRAKGSESEPRSTLRGSEPTPERTLQWRLCVLVGRRFCRRPWEEVVEAAVEGGADAIQLREKELPDRELLDAARRLVSIVGSRAATVINDRPDVALAAGATGVHLGQDDLPIDAVRRLSMIGGDARHLVVGASAHTLEEVDRSIAAGADLCGIGTMFPSATRPDLPASGVEFLRAFVTAHPAMPHLAIGGITRENLPALVDAGCRGVAIGAAICGAPDPLQATRELLALLPSRDLGPD